MLVIVLSRDLENLRFPSRNTNVRKSNFINLFTIRNKHFIIVKEVDTKKDQKSFPQT